MNRLWIKPYGAGPQALVLLHGWGFDSQVWTLLLPQLTQHFTVYLVDLPGFGDSEVMDWLTFKSHLLPALPETFGALGWSLGGLYAMRLAIEHGDRVKQLISVGSAPRLLAEPGWPLMPIEAVEGFSTRMLQEPMKTLENFLRVQAPHQRVTFSPKRSLKPLALEAGLSLLKTWDLRDELSHLPSACFMFGRLDKIVPISACEVMKRRYPHFHYAVFNRAGHAPFLSHPAEFLEALMGYCKAEEAL